MIMKLNKNVEYLRKNKMTEKNQDKKKLQSAFASLNDDNNLLKCRCLWSRWL